MPSQTVRPGKRRRPRLGVLFPHVVLGGGETATLTLAATLAEHFADRLDLRLAALDHGAPGEALTIRRELVERFGAELLTERWRLRPFVCELDVLLWYGVTNAVPRVLLALGDSRPASIRVVHTSRELDGVRFTHSWQRMIDATVCVSPAIARQVPGAVFIPNPAPREFPRGRRRSFFSAGEGPVLGFLGRLLPAKNVAWLIENLASLGARLLVQALATELQCVDDLRRHAAEHGVAERVVFLEPGRDVGTLLRSVDALAVVSRDEAFPRVVLEAGRLGVPVIATPVGALPELFEDSVLFVGLAAGKPSLEDFREALRRLDAAPWGERLRARIERLADPVAVARRYVEVVEEVLGGG